MSHRTTFALLVLLIALYESQEQIAFPTFIRLLENAICQQHYEDQNDFSGPVDESMCKVGAIQHRLAYLRGSYSFWNTLPALLLAPLYGGLSDRIGRRIMLSAALLGMMLAIGWVYFVCTSWSFMSSDLILLTAIFRLIGGGPFLVIALYVAIVNDLSDRETRSINIYKAFVVKLVIDLVAPQAASLLLGHSLWLPTLVCVLLLTACLLDLSIMQETMPEMHASVRHSSFASKRPGLGTALDQYKDMMSCRPLRMGLLIDLLVQFRYNELQLFPPYISVRFEWRIAETARLLSIVPGVSLVLYMALPWLTGHLLRRYNTPIQKTDLNVVRLSCAMLCLGTFCIAFGGTLGATILGISVYALGFNVRAPLLSVLSTHVDPQFAGGKLFGVISAVDAFGHMVGSPIFESLWAAGVHRGNAWQALPFTIIAICFLVSTCLSLVLPLSSGLRGFQDSSQEERDDEGPLLDHTAR